MRILVTGATGFIGERIVQELLQANHVVVAGGRNIAKAKAIIEAGAEFFAGDLADAVYVESLCKDAEIVVHCAGLAGTSGPYADYYRANVQATENLLNAAQVAGTKRFINLSSPSIYFDYIDQYNLKEDFVPKRFSNAYAKTKYLGELAVQAANSSSFLTVSLRPRFVIGAGDQNIFPRMLAMQKEGLLRQIGSGKNIVSVTSIQNLLDLILKILEAPPEAFGQTYNIANAEPVPIWEMINLVCQELDIPTKRKSLPLWLAKPVARLTESVYSSLWPDKEPPLSRLKLAVLSQSMTLDIGKAQKNLGYLPEYRMEDGVREFATWWRQQST